MAPSVGVVVPVYDPDPARLKAYVLSLQETLEPATIRLEIDVPDDEVLTAFESLPIEIATSDTRRGKGAAITAGFEALDTEYLAFVDADGSTPPASLQAILDVLPKGDVPAMAVGSRRHPDARIGSHQTQGRRMMGDLFAWVARRVLPVSLYDYQCGAKALTHSGWDRIREHIYEPGFAWDLEVVTMAGALGCSLTEVPIEWEDQPGSTVDPVSTAIELSMALFQIRHRAKLLRQSNLHEMIATQANDPTALVNRPSDHREGNQ